MVVTESTPLVLGSGSPRRREILAGLGIPIRVVPGDVDERVRTEERAGAYLERITLDKLVDVAKRVADPDRVPGLLVADTIVVVDADVLGKPRDEEDARLLLRRIVGRTHVVWTRYALSIGPNLGTPRVERTVESKVTMRRASDREIDAYAATGEGLDKAGAYAAQGIGAFLVQSIEGSYTNVIGLPACEVIVDLVGSGLVTEFPRATG